MTTPAIDALDYLRNALNSGQVSAFVTQNADGTLAASVDIGPGSDQLEVTPLLGPTGPAGPAQFPLIPQPDIYTDPSDLPAALTNTAADIGKFWIIVQTDGSGNTISVMAYIWYGKQYRKLPFGTQGPEGPYGIIKPFVTLLPPDETSTLVVSGAGTMVSPYSATLDLSIPAGPPGESQPLANFADINETVPPTVGQFLTATSTMVGGHHVWTPQNVGDVPLMPYSVPRSAFTAQFGINFGGAPATIATFVMPAQAWSWKPIVFGQIRMFEVSLSLNPLQIGLEVRLGSATGTLVGRGFGNDLAGVVTIMPHCSSPGSPTTAMTPTNGTGLVAANTSGGPSTLFVNVLNDGILTVYDYNPSDAELFVLACPAT